MTPNGPGPRFACDLFFARDVVVTAGANLGDRLDSGDDPCPGDVYQISRGARPQRMMIEPGEGRTMRHAETGAVVRLRRRLVMMSDGGDALRLLLLDRREAGTDSGELLVLPLTPVEPRTDYTLVQIDDDPDDVRLSDVLCASFLAGTLVSLGDGRQVRIETLRPGDRVLTRDHGAQPVRWVGKVTIRAAGSFAPVVIAAGVLGNDGDLIVSQHHRLFLYQRHDPIGAPGPELLVQAGLLVDDRSVRLRPGGFVDYYSLAFDRHEIIYAHGVPVESLLVTDATIARLPEPLADDLRAQFPGIAQSQHFGTEVTGRLIGLVRDAALRSAAERPIPDPVPGYGPVPGPDAETLPSATDGSAKRDFDQD